MNIQIMGKKMRLVESKIDENNISFERYESDSHASLIVKDIDANEILTIISGPIEFIRKRYQQLTVKE